jgi:hypothetical protein
MAFPVSVHPSGRYLVENSGALFPSAFDDKVKTYELTNGLLSTTPTSLTTEVYSHPGGPMAISANGGANGIIWVVQRHGIDPSGSGMLAPGVLRAYNPADLSVEYYDSDPAGTLDAMDYTAKFNVPLVANGKVFVAGENQLTVYGLLP